MKQKTLAIIALIFLVLLDSFVVADNIIPAYIRGRAAETAYDFTFNFTSDSSCNNVLKEVTATITTDINGIGFAALDISSLTTPPSYMCEYQDGILIAAHIWNDVITKNIIVENIYVLGRVFDDSNLGAIDVVNRLLTNSDEVTVINWQDHTLNRRDGTSSLKWDDAHLMANDELDVILDWDAVGLADFGDTDILTTGNIRLESNSNKIELGDDAQYKIGWDGSDAVQTIISGDYRFSGGDVNITRNATIGGDAVVTGDLTVGDAFLVDESAGAVAINTPIDSVEVLHIVGLTGGAGASGQGILLISGIGGIGVVGPPFLFKGGQGGTINVVSGKGGMADGSDQNNEGGVGGTFGFGSGVGGDAEGTTGNPNNKGGTGGAFSFIGGGGGKAEDTTGGNNEGGTGGTQYITAGGGGNAANAGGTNTGGDGGDLLISSGGGGAGATANGVAGNVIFRIGGSEKMRVDNSGNIGIGTTTPNKELTVVGDVNITGNISYKAIYTQLSDLADQEFSATNTPQPINLTTIDEIYGLSISVSNITISKSGVYNIFAQPQVAAGAGQSGTFHMWLEKHDTNKWLNVSNSNVELSLGSQDEDVIGLGTVLSLNANEKIRVMASVSSTGIFLDTQSPAGEPIIPSIIFSMFKIGN